MLRCELRIELQDIQRIVRDNSGPWFIIESTSLVVYLESSKIQEIIEVLMEAQTKLARTLTAMTQSNVAAAAFATRTLATC